MNTNLTSPSSPLSFAQAAIAWMRLHVSPAAQLSADSRQLQAGDCFLAYRVGNAQQSTDGRQHIEAALKAGAAAILYDADDDYVPLIDSPCFGIPSLAVHIGEIASAWYRQPSCALSMIGVTGTNGKTSCALWIAQALNYLSQRCAVIGTLGAGWPESLQTTGFTTPDAPQLQKWLSQLVQQGAQAVAMEVSSHGLEQGRVNGTVFTTAIFTNLSRDHLDYHGSMEAYQAAKRRLLMWPGLQHAVINTDEAVGRQFLQELVEKNKAAVNKATVKVVAYGLVAPSLFSAATDYDCLYADNIVITEQGTRFTVHAKLTGQSYQTEVNTHIVGRFNVSNLLAVLSALLLQGESWEQALDALVHLQPVPGRMEQFGGRAAPLLIVDYAHTPDALQQALLTLRPIAAARNGKLWCVFGCGGNRDNGKRPQMGRVAEEIADQLVLTSDNPRDEVAETILEMIAAGLQAPQRAQRIADRASAIMYATRHTQPEDVVLIAGKGHEAWQEIAGKKIPFSDVEQVRSALATLRAI